jgi:predicted unusual protein kinase regulating ubiquinone biosynthesis (AarF/ABC1/UbiB family)
MSTLHSNAPAHTLQTSKRTIEAAFDGQSFDDIFEEFDEKPLGVGAIAQVYKAKLKPHLATLEDNSIDRKEANLARRIKKNVDVTLKSSPSRVPSSHVAIKVLHPNIEKIVRRDLRIMGFFAAVINAIPTMEWLSFPDEVEQFGETAIRSTHRSREPHPLPTKLQRSNHSLVPLSLHGIHYAQRVDRGIRPGYSYGRLSTKWRWSISKGHCR